MALLTARARPSGNGRRIPNGTIPKRFRLKTKSPNPFTDLEIKGGDAVQRLSLEELQKALSDTTDDRAEIEREKLKIARERLELEKRKQKERERQNRVRENASGRKSDEGWQWIISLSITAFILILSLAFAIWILTRF